MGCPYWYMRSVILVQVFSQVGSIVTGSLEIRTKGLLLIFLTPEDAATIVIVCINLMVVDISEYQNMYP